MVADNIRLSELSKDKNEAALYGVDHIALDDAKVER